MPHACRWPASETCGCGRRAGRSRGAVSAFRNWNGALSARPADTRGAPHITEGLCREMVADHQLGSKRNNPRSPVRVNHVADNGDDHEGVFRSTPKAAMKLILSSEAVSARRANTGLVHSSKNLETALDVPVRRHRFRHAHACRRHPRLSCSHSASKWPGERELGQRDRNSL
jgi:hypothetical protein